jgi:hypothetical protein
MIGLSLKAKKNKNIYIKLAFKGFFVFLLCFFGYYQVDLETIWYFINIKCYLKTKIVGK